ncbi:CRISPR-associated protein Cas4 [Marinitenerispora sediminis]|uniref:CRISPR-associated exonuclease Cas4 n=1 Tax=Marinitenerispora sediminis TaxID=1931232 RepID=A0A368T1Q4_9ACTN|nr:CRISPR-associated protein Cas4 [Marinitenerispora sediminis]RCV53958.1 CRISPR-associated protein Cas4 [Marinitenerispora sediminis]RCV57091.1 CRISPR-associated protein Cas4 [Marinitenerispora sediminis]RCV58914.1 CRISPR-associated protein Cas4 [Marinitenerispora sediminis]
MTSATTWAAPPGGPPQVTLSALEHYAYCGRQAGLILLEDGYVDDAATTRGTLLHQRVHEPGIDTCGELRVLRALPVWSDTYGLTGVCDVVELRSDGHAIPVEHKSGDYTPGGPADVQLAGQAMCLEEMFGRTIPSGQIYSGTQRRRHRVAITDELRQRVLDTADAVRKLIQELSLPPPAADARCRRCSMNTSCMPKLLANQRSYTSAAAQLFRPAPEATWND